MNLAGYPAGLAQKLEFDQVKQLLAGYCVSEAAREKAVSLQPVADYNGLNKRLNEAWEMFQLERFDQSMPDEPIPSVMGFLHLARIEGHFFDEEQCFSLLKILAYSKRLISFFDSRKENYPFLYAISAEIAPANEALKLIERIIDKNGKVKPNASKELGDISSDLNKLQLETRRKLDTIFRQAKTNGWAAETGVTVREGRLVIPILAEHKRKIKGFVHDESSTGQTVYLEPAELLEHNNDIRNLELALRREIRRILIRLTADLVPHLGDIQAGHHLAAEFDFLRATARLANRFPHVARPALKNEPVIHFKQAFHPLLYFHHQSLGKKVVPLNLTLTREKHILVVSGPNAGGKSVTLKTVGLLQLMGQSGLLLPIAEGSSLGIFNRLMVDLGDEQSIENDLSTYSSHLTNMRAFTEQADEATLFLIDEFGTGTDPALGGPIAEAILERLHQQAAFGVVNTHYSNLKLLATKLSGIVNGAMGFDTQTLEPRYELSVGKPGSSFAFEIARKIGLASEIIEAAQSRIGINQQDVESLLVELSKEKAELEQLKLLLAAKDQLLEDLLNRTESREAELKAQKKKILDQAREEASALINKANRTIENTIREIKEAGADKERTKQLRSGVEELKQEIEQQNRREKKEQSLPKPQEDGVQELKVGGSARIKDSQSIGLVLAINKNEVEMAVGELRMLVKKNRLEPVSQAEARRTLRSAGSGVQVVAEAIASFSPKLDLRGFRGQEALQELDRFLDKAVMAGYNRLELLHGKGDGILRKLIRDHLRRQKFVAHFESEHADRGGDGITLVELK